MPIAVISVVIRENFRSQPGLDEIAAAAALSPFHFQRLFTRWAGVSPKQFLGYLTVGHAKRALDRAESVLDATYDVGLSGPSRLHDLFVNFEGVTPGQYKAMGDGLVVRYGIHKGYLGPFVVGHTDRAQHCSCRWRHGRLRTRASTPLHPTFRHTHAHTHARRALPARPHDGRACVNDDATRAQCSMAMRVASC